MSPESYKWSIHILTALPRYFEEEAEREGGKE